MDGDGLARSGAAGAARGKAVRSIEAGSPASGTIIEVGDVVKRIDGHAIADVLDYMYHSYGRRPLVELRGRGGGAKLVRFRKREGEDLGLRFEEPLMD
ncbi:MAG: hypothetical protein LBC21_01520, partial [Oscillospiraceae bacterium]|nr:hypothetical protein [Oscillospiraceae bacterium]